MHPFCRETLHINLIQSYEKEKPHLFIHSFIHVILFSAVLAFTSCDRSSILDNTGTDSDGITLYDQTIEMASNRTDQPSPKEVSDAYFIMVEKVQKMDREAIDSFSNEDILELGKPILDATKNSVKLGNDTLQKLNSVLAGFAESIQTITREEHAEISRDVNQILATDRSRTTRNLNTEDVRRILLNINGGASTMSYTCEDMFDHDPYMGYIHLYPGDYLSIANDLCPAGSIFYVHNGTYNQAFVGPSKDGNYWLGVGGIPKLNGQGSVSRAFNGGMKYNNIGYLEIQNYTDHGIYSASPASTNILIQYVTFRNIGGNKSGRDEFGAIHFDNTKNVLVRNSYFNNVSHSVRFRFSEGPLQVLNNEALNTGFGFFQCNQCEGSNIKINNNSLEHSTIYSQEELHDFINIFNSNGSNSSNRIQVKNNRARVNLVGNNANGVSQYGCAALLGDEGGSYQEAINNIGVNPGACGIGLASGDHMYISGNKMYSQAVQPGISNVGYYSANYAEAPQPSCTYHNFESQSNSADWMCTNPVGNCNPQNPIKNLAHAKGDCTDQNNLTLTDSILNSLIKDEALGAGIWINW